MRRTLEPWARTRLFLGGWSALILSEVTEQGSVMSAVYAALGVAALVGFVVTADDR